MSISTPESWTPERATVVLLHGLCGCEGSPYMVRVASKLYRRGLRTVRMNGRGCGPGESLACGLPHAGRSADLGAVLAALREESPTCRTAVIGFSLGGNIAIKYAGERSEVATDGLVAVASVGAPLDLAACARRLGRRRNRPFERHFLRLLRRKVQRRHRRCEGLGPVDLPAGISLWEFDDRYTSRHSGFVDAADYYARSSGASVVEDVQVPTWMLFSRDDPFIERWEPRGSVDAPLSVTVTDRGGHLGFLGHPRSASGVRWLDSALLAFLEHIGVLPA